MTSPNIIDSIIGNIVVNIIIDEFHPWTIIFIHDKYFH